MGKQGDCYCGDVVLGGVYFADYCDVSGIRVCSLDVAWVMKVILSVNYAQPFELNLEFDEEAAEAMAELFNQPVVWENQNGKEIYVNVRAWTKEE